MTETHSKHLDHVVIVGGGTAGWITAAGLSRLYSQTGLRITLIESEDIGTVGVGEATLPHIRHFNDRLGINEREFMRQTRATFKLGIEFRDWGGVGDAYVHPFGAFGEDIAGVKFHQHWTRARHTGQPLGSFGDWSLPVRMLETARFTCPSGRPSDLSSRFAYAYHFDARLYADFLRAYAEKRGVVRVEGKVMHVDQCPHSGFVTALGLENGRRIDGQLFIDCSGFRGLLIEDTLKAGYDTWSTWLPCDTAWAVPCAPNGPFVPGTRATARTAGWQWRIPLQHRVGNGHVFSSAFTKSQAALDLLMQNLEGEATADPRMLRFTTGVRRRQWDRNVVAIGLSSGFLEPLESTSIHLIQAAVTHLAELLPDLDFRSSDIEEFNRVMHLEYERVRDLLILHYHATRRSDSDFWRHCQTMNLPDSLRYRLELFKARGIVVTYRDGIFHEPSWLAVLMGQGIVPSGYDPLSHRLDDARLMSELTRQRDRVAQTVAAMPSHADYLKAHLTEEVFAS